MNIEKFLFRVYYDGYHYSGFQRQPNGFTIENFIEISLIRSKLITSLTSNKYISVSRTDAKVSAISNIFGINCAYEPNLSRINNYLPGNRSIKIWDFAPITDEFNVKSSIFKIYTYYFTKADFDEIIDVERLYQFEGTHNFHAFIKNDGAGELNSNSLIYEVKIKKFYQGYLVIIKGDRFGREQIRRMIGFITADEYSKINPQTILKSPNKIDIRPANPEFLYLANIEYDEKIMWKNNSQFKSNGMGSNIQSAEVLALLQVRYFPTNI